MIVNLTQHPATPEQVAAGVVDLAPARRADLVELLTFDEIPERSDMLERAHAIAELHWRESDVAEDGPVHAAMIGGAPFFMASLECVLRESGITPLYAFSRRESVEETQPDGSVRKINVFRHAGFVGLGDD